MKKQVLSFVASRLLEEIGNVSQESYNINENNKEYIRPVQMKNTLVICKGKEKDWNYNQMMTVMYKMMKQK